MTFIGYVIGIFLLLLFVIGPFVITLVQIFAFAGVRVYEREPMRWAVIDFMTVGIGILFSVLYLSFIKSVIFSADWDEVLANSERHTPISASAVLTVGAIALIAAAGYVIVNFIPFDKMPPLLMAASMAAMYLGTGESIVWGIQISGQITDGLDFMLLLLPLNCILITARTVMSRIFAWNQWSKTQSHLRKIGQISLLNGLNRILGHAWVWPIAAFILMWPLLGILMMLLMLAGQAPDAPVKAWIETGGWKLSQKIPPQNIYYDEHYLCTVAAGGHPALVHPLRLGVRHGHKVTVNRQLCIANAFEQILEEKTPKFHRIVREFYDQYGFPLARIIRSRWIADLIYIVMKPLEWVFLIVLYLTDVRPENRIVLQYTGKGIKDFSGKS